MRATVTRARHPFVLVAVVVSTLAWHEGVAPAATFVVDDVADVIDVAPGDGICLTVGGTCTLRAAMQEANALVGRDTIEAPSGKYVLTIPGRDENASASGDLDVTDDLVLRGSGSDPVVIDANGIDRVLHVVRAVSLSISGIVLLGGSADPSGAGLQNDGGTVVLSHCTIRENRARAGAGIENVGGAVVLEDSSVESNETELAGPTGIENSGDLVLIRSRVTRNDAVAGAVAGIANSGSTTMVDSEVSQNFADFIGGIANGGTLVVMRSLIAGNGAGSLVNGGELQIEDSTIRNNGGGGEADGDEEAAGILNFGTAVVRNSTISGNGLEGQGAGMINEGTMMLENTTISENFASLGFGFGLAGGILNRGGGMLRLESCTVTRNVAKRAGGILVEDGTVVIRNTLIGGNADLVGSPDCAGVLTSEGHNVVQETTGCIIVGSEEGNIVNLFDSGLGTLRDNGGYVQTHALLNGSVAIDSASPAPPGSGGTSCPPTDARGVVRPQGGACDVGAYELAVGAPVVCGAPGECDDGDPCTDDICDSLTGCRNLLRTCDDGIPCTMDTCHRARGCTHVPFDALCEDGDICSQDVCDASTGCRFVPIVDCGATCSTDTGCDDHDPCNGVERCDVGTGCVAGDAPSCDDGDACTTDRCIPVAGCVNTLVSVGLDPVQCHATNALALVATPSPQCPPRCTRALARQLKRVGQLLSALGTGRTCRARMASLSEVATHVAARTRRMAAAGMDSVALRLADETERLRDAAVSLDVNAVCPAL